MAGLKVVFASFASIGIVAAALVSAAVVAPRLIENSVAPASAASERTFVGIAPASFEDASGDASDVGWGDLGTTADCWLLSCDGTVPTLVSPRPAEHLDIVSVSIAEPSADEVVLTLGIARLDEGLAQLEAPSGLHRMVSYTICIYDENGCARDATLVAMRHGDAGHIEARFTASSQTCNEWWWCSWPLVADVQYGAPATITFTVPKAWFAYDEMLDVHHLEASTAWYDQPTAFPMWHGGATLHTPARHTHGHTPTPGSFGVADITYPLMVDASVAPASAPVAPALDAPLAAGLGGMTHAYGSQYDHPETDLVGFDVYDDADGGIALVFAVREAREHPTFDFDYAVALGFEDKPVMEIGYRQEHGEAMGYAGLCIMEECQESRTYEVDVEFLPGAPAFIVVHVPADVLADLSGAEPGDTTTLAWVSAMITDGSQYFGDYEGDVYGDVHHAFMADEILGVLPFTLGGGHRAPLDAFAAEHAH